MPSTGSPRPLRRDAAANRERLLDAASELFAEHGLGVTLNDIAHHAGVGVGTAYRRFRNKEEVIDALFEQRLNDVADLARESLGDPDPWHGLVAFLERSLEMQFGDRGLTQIINNPALGDERVADARDRIAPLIRDIVERAQRHGVVRADLDQTDLIFTQVGLTAIIDASRGIAPGLYRRYLTLFLDGIRTTGRDTPTPLPAPPLTADQTHAAMTRQRRTPADRSATAPTHTRDPDVARI